MKFVFGVIALSFLMLNTSCSKSANNAAPPDTVPGSVHAKIKMPHVKYPAAIIFEGGRGDPGLLRKDSTYTPLWRLYICLQKTTQQMTAQANIDFVKIGFTVQRTFLNSDTDEMNDVEQLNNVILNYAYTTELSDDPDNNYGYAYGNATIQIQSRQSWQPVMLSQNKKRDHQSYADLDFFNVSATSETLAQFGESPFQVNGETYYLSNTLDRFTYSEKDNVAHTVEACEKADQDSVLQVGSEITPSL